MAWQNETRETCLFRDDWICRRLHPSVVMYEGRPLAYYLSLPKTLSRRFVLLLGRNF